MVKNLPASSGDARDEVQSLNQEDPLEDEVTTYSSILAWKIPWTEEPDGLQSICDHKEWDTTKQLSTHQFQRSCI